MECGWWVGACTEIAGVVELPAQPVHPIHVKVTGQVSTTLLLRTVVHARVKRTTLQDMVEKRFGHVSLLQLQNQLHCFITTCMLISAPSLHNVSYIVHSADINVTSVVLLDCDTHVTYRQSPVQLALLALALRHLSSSP